MNEKLKKAIIFIIPLALILLISLSSILGNRALKLPENEPGLKGNSAGNLYNGGSFCEQDGIVYFSNPYDGGSIYAMNPDQSGIRKVVTAQASCLNAGGGYLYYFSSSSAGQSGLGYVRDGRGIYRVDSAGKKNILLKQGTTDSLLLLGNYLYYTDFSEDISKPENAVVTLSRFTTEGENDTVLVSDHPKLGPAAEGSVYFAGMSGDHHLYALDYLTAAATEVSSLNMYEPTLQDGRVYFLDMDDDLKLKSVSLYDNNLFTISEERIETFNLYGDTIYYQTIDESGGDNYAFKRIRIDGSGEEVLREGVVRDIQITSGYVYFRDYKADLPVYQLPTYGSGSIQVFQAAADAVALP
ncbi:MAG: DUF5050 domain-containing protein [Lachnospiraceae bacterium]|nr:DUF5050 domain-containing protein [Lachnospiraceae bacterium]